MSGSNQMRIRVTAKNDICSCFLDHLVSFNSTLDTFFQ